VRTGLKPGSDRHRGISLRIARSPRIIRSTPASQVLPRPPSHLRTVLIATLPGQVVALSAQVRRAEVNVLRPLVFEKPHLPIGQSEEGTHVEVLNSTHLVEVMEGSALCQNHRDEAALVLGSPAEEALMVHRSDLGKVRARCRIAQAPARVETSSSLRPPRDASRRFGR